jgi:guanylate kinase
MTTIKDYIAITRLAELKNRLRHQQDFATSHLNVEMERNKAWQSHINNVEYFNRLSATAMQDIRDIIKDAAKAKE